MPKLSQELIRSHYNSWKKKQSNKTSFVLSCYANKQRTCFPSISTLADDLGSSQSSIDRWIKELKEYKYIERIGRKLTLK